MASADRRLYRSPIAVTESPEKRRRKSASGKLLGRAQNSDHQRSLAETVRICRCPDLRGQKNRDAVTRVPVWWNYANTRLRRCVWTATRFSRRGRLRRQRRCRRVSDPVRLRPVCQIRVHVCHRIRLPIARRRPLPDNCR